MSKAELESCLNILRQYLRCSICLDDLYNPVITPCAHTFCKFCLDNHLNQKRSGNCPLCNRIFSKRSLKVPDKITKIVVACKKVISTYETEVKTTIITDDGPFDHLHLSQELTQQVSNIAPITCSNSTEYRLPKNPTINDVTKTVSANVERRPYRSRIRLGTSSRNKGKIYPEANCNDEVYGSALQDQLTQPMTGACSDFAPNGPLVDSHDESKCNRKHSSDLDELFSLTQATQPMVETDDCESLFAPVVGLSENQNKENPKTNHCLEKAPHVDGTSVRTLTSRPPLPPAHSTRKQKARIPINTDAFLPPKGNTKKRASNNIGTSEPPKKQSKRCSSLSTLHCNEGMMTKTHEVLFHVEPSRTEVRDTETGGSRKHVTKNKSPGTHKKVLRKCHSDSYRHRGFNLSGKINSLKKSDTLNVPSKIYSPSYIAGKKLLRKYHIGSFHSSECLNRVARTASFKSPGWSRWREMCRELRRRSSSFRLSFKNLSKSCKSESKSRIPDSNATEDGVEFYPRSKIPKRSESLSSWVGFSLSRWSNQLGRRSKRKFSDISKTTTPLVLESQPVVSEAECVNVYTEIIHETPLSPDKSFGNKPLIRVKHRDRKSKERCSFVLPLHRLLPSNYAEQDTLRPFQRTSARMSNSRPPLILFTPDRNRESGNLETPPINLRGVSISKSPELLHSDSRPKTGGSPVDSCFESLHCSACGETLVICPENGNWQNSPLASRSDFALFLQNSFNKSFSASSSYWQAEDPGDAVMTDLHLDSMVSNNRPFAETSNLSFSAFKDSSGVPDFTGSNVRNKIAAFEQKPNHPTTHYCPLNIVNQSIDDGLPKNADLNRPNTSNALSQTDSYAQSQAISAPSQPLLQRTEDNVCKSPRETLEPPDDSVPQQNPLGSPETFTNVSTYQNSSSEVMPTVDRERLRHECEELEAVVAALQQQLEAEADDLSPQTEDALLRSACTEPFNDDVIMSSAPSKHQDRVEDPTSQVKNIGPSSVDKGSPNKKQKNEDIEVPKLSEDYQPEIAETATPENLEVIPSSQTEEDWEQPTKTDTTSTQHATNMDSQSTTLSNMNKSSQPVYRVDASQPTTSSLGNSLCELIPGSFVKPASLTTTTTTAATVPAPSDSQTAFNMTPGLTQLSLTNLTHCPETNLDSDVQTGGENWSNSQVIVKNQSRTSTVKAVTGSSLSSADMVILRQFCRRFGVLEHSRFMPGVTTHVIIKGETDRPRVVRRTLKYFMAILNRAWIVNTDWIRQCLAAHALIDESPYEIEGDTVCGDCHEGPRRGRLGVPAIIRPLDRAPFQTTLLDNATTTPNDAERRPFSGFWLCAFDSLGALSLNDFVQLATDGGANKVFKKPEDLISAASKLLASYESTKLAKPKAIILTNRDSSTFNLKKCEELYHTHGVPVISIDWMLNCISLYRHLPISQVYRICPSTSQPQKLH